MKKTFIISAIIFFSNQVFAQKITGIDTTKFPYKKKFEIQKKPIIKKESDIEYALLDNMPIKKTKGTMPTLKVDTLQRMPNTLKSKKHESQ